VANHHRIEIIRLLAEEGGLNLDEIARRIGGNFKTVGEHTRKLVQSGLVNKRHDGKSVIHTLSPYGRTFTRFIAAFSKQGVES
jgi:DNA-binding transcriptional ArsR family regulator